MTSVFFKQSKKSFRLTKPVSCFTYTKLDIKQFGKIVKTIDDHIKTNIKLNLKRDEAIEKQKELQGIIEE